jgi:hypothetical protein
MIRYFGDYVISTLQYERLKVALPSQLNDPFDCSTAFEGAGDVDTEIAEREISLWLRDKDFCDKFRQVNLVPEGFDDKRIKDGVWQFRKEYIDKLQKDPLELIRHRKVSLDSSIDKNFRLLCLNSPLIENGPDILMWSHYGNSHKGFRLHFNDGFLNGKELCSTVMDYAEDDQPRPTMHIADRYVAEKFSEYVKVALSTKAKCWHYEKEVRFFIHPDHCIHDIKTKREFIDFNPHGLARIDIGISADNEVLINLVELLKQPRYEHVEIQRAIEFPTIFRLKYDKITVDELCDSL